jgi:peroxiredoxin
MKKVFWVHFVVLFFSMVAAIHAQPVAVNAPDFTLFDNKGKRISLSDYKGKVVYLDFWATWCKPCMEEVPGAIELAQKLSSDTTIVFIAVSIDADKEKWMKIVEKKKMQGIQLVSSQGKESDVLMKYQVETIPRFVIIDKQGLVAVYNASGPREAETEKVLKRLSKQE